MRANATRTATLHAAHRPRAAQHSCQCCRCAAHTANPVVRLPGVEPALNPSPAWARPASPFPHPLNNDSPRDRRRSRWRTPRARHAQCWCWSTRWCCWTAPSTRRRRSTFSRPWRRQGAACVVMGSLCGAIRRLLECRVLRPPPIKIPFLVHTRSSAAASAAHGSRRCPCGTASASRAPKGATTTTSRSCRW